jgi:endonuclease-3
MARTSTKAAATASADAGTEARATKASSAAAAPPRLPTAARREAAAEVYHRLSALYPDARCALDHQGPWQLLCATILSAQCTDVRVNQVTPQLFARWPGPAELAAAAQEEVEEVIKSAGFFREKAKSLIGMSDDIARRFGGEVPGAMKELTTLRGVGRKTANVIIGVAFGGAGMVVDTHVRRLSNLLGWTGEQDPEKIERDLMALHPPERWTDLGHALIYHGRNLCPARKPRCAECPVLDLCPAGAARTQDA